MFKFGFAVDDGNQAPATINEENRDLAAPSVGGALDEPLAEEVDFSMEGMSSVSTEETLALTPTYTLIKASIKPSRVASFLAAAVIDLVPGQYEGGFKIWEGGIDLAVYLAEQLEKAAESQTPLWQGQRVLELGCGHGLPGIVTLQGGAECHFQDFNKEVLQTLTMANVYANWNAHCVHSKITKPAPAKYFSGSWSGLVPLLDKEMLNGTYDLVLTAETIYSLEAMNSLYNCIKQCLRRPKGRALVAAKSYYFGVGGSIAAFKNMVQQEGIFSFEHIKTIHDSSVVREIIEIAWL